MTRFYPLMFGLIAMIVSSLMLYNGHNFGGDFSQYIAQAIALATDSIPNQITNNTFIIDKSDGTLGAYIYPWGLSLLLAPIYKIFGFHLVAFKAINVLCFGAFVAIFYISMKRFLKEHLCIIATLLFALNPLLLYFSNNIMSDIPFLLFSFVSVVCLARLFQAQSLQIRQLYIYCITGSVFVLFATLTRTNGVMILVALFLCQIVLLYAIYKKDSRFAGAYLAILDSKDSKIALIALHILPYIIVCSGIVIANYTLGAGGSGHLDVLSQTTPKTIIRNTLYYVWIFSDFFALPNPFLPLNADFKYATLLPNPLNFALLLIILPLLFLGIKESVKRARFATLFIVLFVATQIGLLILWAPLQGVRFVFCVLPFLVYFAMAGFPNIHSKTYKKAIILMGGGANAIFRIQRLLLYRQKYL